MKALFGATAVIEGLTGVALVVAPSLVTTLLFGEVFGLPAAEILGYVAGAALLALATACWLARHDDASAAARGLIGAMLLYNGGTTAALAYALLSLQQHGLLLAPAIGLHAAMALWCVLSLRRNAAAHHNIQDISDV
jgi:hypothetical protein